ncbi:hypothetical protein AMECASPLE_023020 [Ameca splendens]|uniref:Uncharacterized protein n=1 Tax=Ameca splendens TaxID=208324 RepID=A0ABV0XSU5_9TELE
MQRKIPTLQLARSLHLQVTNSQSHIPTPPHPSSTPQLHTPDQHTQISTHQCTNNANSSRLWPAYFHARGSLNLKINHAITIPSPGILPVEQNCPGICKLPAFAHRMSEEKKKTLLNDFTMWRGTCIFLVLEIS